MPNHETARWERARFQNNQIFRVLGSAFALVFYAGSALQAQAAVTISADATQNMTCSNGVCAPTAPDAVLNVGDLQNLLASGNVEVTTTGSGVQASDIFVKAALSWSTSNALTVDAYRSIVIGNPVSVAGSSVLALDTNDGGSGGALSFGPNGNVAFASLSGGLTINGVQYTLVNTVQALASAVAANPAGDYAFANSYNAGQDGTYASVPVLTTFTGVLEGLGNAISRLKIKDSADVNVGLFAEVGSGGTLRDLSLPNSNIVATGGVTNAEGTLVGENDGNVIGCYASGSVAGKRFPRHHGVVAGGLVGLNIMGTIDHSHANVSVAVEKGDAGGVVGGSNSAITNSYATGNVSAGNHAFVGGLVGYLANGNNSSGSINVGYATGAVTGGNSASAGGLVGFIFEQPIQVANSYATGSVSVGSSKTFRSSAFAGGLIGGNGSSTEVADSYSTGTVSGGGGEHTYLGGSIGSNSSAASGDYWDTTTSGTDIGVGYGIDQGVTGLTTEQLQSGLPAGFDPKIWSEKPNINGGLPYLLAIPPKK